VGRITSLHIQPADRRRGRGTVAALAAEEVLRGWGCDRVRVTVPADSQVALRLVTALGYLERRRRLLKRLSCAPPPLPRGSLIRQEFQDWVPAWRAAVPDGHDIPGVLRVLCHGGKDVGLLRLGLRDRDDPKAPAWVFGVEVAEEWRGQGHGRTLLLAAERECLTAGCEAIALSVSSGNAPALGLCGSLGYRAIEYSLDKPLV
jgi:ribosomal protein S18 acetylase RimI-like enzyme